MQAKTSLKARCGKYKGIYWHKMELKIQVYIFSKIKLVKINDCFGVIC